MKLTQYASGVKTFNKTEIAQDIAIQRGFVLSLVNTLRLAKSQDIDLAPVERRWSVTKSIERELQLKGHRLDFITFAEGGLSSFPLLLDVCEEVLKKESDSIIAGATLTIRQSNVLMIIDHCNFFCTFLNHALEVMLSMALSNKDADASGLPRADLELLNRSWGMFLDIGLRAYTDTPGVIKTLKNAPDVEIDETAIDVLSRDRGEANLRASMVRNIGIHYFLPMYWIKNGRKELDLLRIKANRESNESAAMKIEQLTNRKNGQNDPKLESQIRRYQESIIKKRAAIDDIVSRYNDPEV